MATAQQLASLAAGLFTRIDKRVDNGDGTFTFQLVGGGMAPKYRANERYTYDSAVAFAALVVGDVIVVEITIGTYQVIRYHSKSPTGTLFVKYDAAPFPESAVVRASYYLGRLTT